MMRDRKFFMAHVADVFRECGYLQNAAQYERLLGIMDEQYPTPTPHAYTLGSLGRLYFTLRFGKELMQPSPEAHEASARNDLPSP